MCQRIRKCKNDNEGVDIFSNRQAKGLGCNTFVRHPMLSSGEHSEIGKCSWAGAPRRSIATAHRSEQGDNDLSCCNSWNFHWRPTSHLTWGWEGPPRLGRDLHAHQRDQAPLAIQELFDVHSCRPCTVPTMSLQYAHMQEAVFLGLSTEARNLCS